MREIRPSGSEGGAAQTNAPFLPLSRSLLPAKEFVHAPRLQRQARSRLRISKRQQGCTQSKVLRTANARPPIHPLTTAMGIAVF